MAGQHAKFSPSSAHRWARCAGALVMEGPRKEATTIYQAKGTAGHTLAAVNLDLDTNATDDIGRTIKADGFEFVVDREMAEGVQEYIELVRGFIEQGFELHIEQAVPLDHMTAETGAEGTSDSILIDRANRRLIAIDLKMGRGELVEAAENEQLGMYLSGAYRKHVGSSIAGRELQNWEFVGIICQPLIKNTSSWELTGNDLWHFEADIDQAAKRARKAEDPRVDIDDFLEPGEKQCRWCTAKDRCPALARIADNFIKETTAAAAHEFSDLTEPLTGKAVSVLAHKAGASLAQMYAKVPLVELLIGAVKARVESQLIAGETVPGFYLTPGKKGNRKWIDEAKVLAVASQNNALQHMHEKYLISPADAEKKFKKLLPDFWGKLQNLYDQAPGKPTIAEDGSGKPVYVVKPVKEDFDDTTAPPVAQTQTGAWLAEEQR